MPTLPPAAESSPKTCRNCDAPLHGPYCSACGQHDVDYHRSFRHVCEDLLEGMFHFEGKFFVSVAWLIGWPGRLTKEFIAGRRQRQLNPLRFYLFVSVLFFLQRSLQSDGHLVGGHAEIDLNGEPVTARPDPAEPAKDGSPGEAGRERGNAADASSPALAGVLTEHRKPHEAPKKPARPAASAAGPAKPSDAERPIIEFSPAPGLAQTLEHKLSSRELTWSDVLTEIEHRIPTVFFFGVPLFALLLKLLYLGSGRLYLEHLIFSLHLHTWAFLALLVAVDTSNWPRSGRRGSARCSVGPSRAGAAGMC